MAEVIFSQTGGTICKVPGMYSFLNTQEMEGLS